MAHFTTLFTQAELDAQIADGMVKAQRHPLSDLTILNYTQRAQFTPEAWNHVTDYCRGLIIDDAGMIVARGFKKFWNLGDSRHPETMIENIPHESPLLTCKLDGSLGIGYRIGNEWSISTRGSFSSDQAIWATGWIRNNHPTLFVPDGWTPVFEIIYPENQIVVRYDFSGLVLLAMINNATGEEYGYAYLRVYAVSQGLKIVEQFDKSLTDCSAEDNPNEEGYVASFPVSGREPLRVKVKFETYCKLHKLLTQTSAISIWETLRDGLDLMELTVNAPDEFKVWIASVEERLRGEYVAIENAALSAMLSYDGEKQISTPAHKKSFAMWVLSEHKTISSILFSMVERKKYDAIIWKMIRPIGLDEKSFRLDADG